MSAAGRRPALPLLVAATAGVLLVASCGRTAMDLPLDPGGDPGGAGAASAGADASSSGVGVGGESASGTGGFAAVGGATSAGGGSSGDAGVGGSGGAPVDPIGCLTCVATSCPEVLACVQDPTCGQGLACLVIECGVGGMPDLACIAGCFDGDIQAALEAIQVLTCVIGTCGPDCAGLLPDLPGP